MKNLLTKTLFISLLSLAVIPSNVWAGRALPAVVILGVGEVVVPGAAAVVPRAAAVVPRAAAVVPRAAAVMLGEAKVVAAVGIMIGGVLILNGIRQLEVHVLKGVHKRIVGKQICSFSVAKEREAKFGEIVGKTIGAIVKKITKRS